MLRMLKIVLVTCLLTISINAEDVSSKKFLGENVTANLRGFYFDRGFDNTAPRARALSTGGIISYKSNTYEGISVGASYFGSFRTSGIFTREESIPTSIFGRSGEDLSFMGEAFVQYKVNNINVKIGRQRLNTPLANDHDLRMLPSTYQGATMDLTNFKDSLIQFGYINSYSGFGSKENGFVDYNYKFGSDGLGYIYVTNKTIPNLKLAGQYIHALDSTDDLNNDIQVVNYYYADAQYDLKTIGEKTYVKFQVGGNKYQNETDSIMYGAKFGTTIGKIDAAILVNEIANNRFKAIEAGPMFSDWQQGYGNYEASSAVGAQLSTMLCNNLSAKIGYVVVAANDSNTVDDFSEFNLDSTYVFNKSNKLRLRYSIKNQTPESTREDRDDLRVIYYLNF